MTFFLGLLRPFLPYIIMAAIAGGGFLWLKNKYYQEGYTAALEDVRKHDEEAAREAGEAREKVKNCTDSGGEWDVTRGVCITER